MAARRAHVLVVEVGGQWRVRAAVERAVLDRGWTLASSPADADVLAVCGSPGPELGEAIEGAWHQLPGPRVRIDVAARDSAPALLQDVYTRLLDTGGHRRDAQERPSAADLLDASNMDHGDMDHGDMDHGEMDHGDMDHGEMDHGDMDHGEMDHGGMDHGDMDHGGMDHGETDHGGMDHGDMDHGDMEMAPGGIALAEGGEDRDGLEMDVLTVPLGPVLPYWPGGLVVRCRLQGDVIVEASGEFLDADASAAAASDVTAAEQAARSLDNLVSLLALAGWEDPAAEARNLRDELLKHGRNAVTERFEQWQRRIRRSRLLAFALRDLSVLHAEDLAREGMPSRLAGDSHDRVLTMLDRTQQLLTGEGAPDHVSPAVEDVARLVTGLDLAAARLVVASLDLHTLVSASDNEVSHAR